MPSHADEQKPLEVAANPLMALGFSWVSALMRRGAKRQLQFSDLFKLPEDLQPGICYQRLWSAWAEVQAYGKFLRLSWIRI